MTSLFLLHQSEARKIQHGRLFCLLHQSYLRGCVCKLTVKIYLKGHPLLLLLLIGQKRKLVKPVNRAKRRDFSSYLQGKQGWNKAKPNYFRVYNEINNNVLGHRVKLREEGTRQNKQNWKVKSNQVKQHFKLRHLRPNRRFGRDSGGDF